MGNRERRWKRLPATPAFLIDFLQQRVPRTGRAMEVVEMEGLPIGTEVHHVSYDYIRDRFDFYLEHLSFDLVPDGELIPEVDPKPTFRRILVKRVED